MKLLSALILPIILIGSSALAAPSKLVKDVELTPEMTVVENYLIATGAAVACVSFFEDKYSMNTEKAAMGLAVSMAKADVSDEDGAKLLENGLDVVVGVFSELDTETQGKVCEALLTDEAGKDFFTTK